ncbi:hypothetical protein [Phytohabitans houttuyneae]|uniref:Uncharacterized protein n=1 Tax=Phytohabitans houttuyneae TaxID=1076126 RepID=A0A6V8KBR3_9ACTN|nr:hypothetical protein [Phytohabitans houttuyneae]GFJ79157.1 hypothetical protein Phou_033370 [Phytohabitans houttuyneae]
MAIVHAVVLALALVALVFLPCAVAFFICSDGPVRHIRRRLGARRERLALHRLDRTLGQQAISLAELDEHQPSIQQIAADLRRLDRQRLGIATHSKVWHAAVLLAYDDRLRLASRCLGVPEHLDQLDGVDLEIERVRVEGELEAAGLALRPGAPRHQDH